ncbi:MAG: efflux RND transporter periplasmic adaptor subunit [Methylomonas sp.]|nr:efflux RND transporter periplasmic adaptor subunit [Methylomonas sp.]PPD22295.1 MAG: efflux transporter periplasmic adaptor subunit [Methylomonas sp.]PPD27787.1 MAG: efflux transporter periplasmic adaptor subunit [Methylomonas sp.]PPD39798.1 MAG: efflux transporter periplasmic adaptor subunit [Methylomonas sp.]PPD42611.1 MAG: efflux transporter periplasmic adaptor subunit [Methylomonas sp.]
MASLLYWLASVPFVAYAESPKTVEATDSLLKMLKVEAVGSKVLQDSLRVPARIELNQQRVARIGASVTGRVTEINAVLGQKVKKGERLALLNSTELGQAQSDYLKAISQVNLRQLAVERARRLFQSDVIAEAELLDREGILAEAEIDLRTAEDQLRVMGMSEADLKQLASQRRIHSFSPVIAGIAGTVIARDITLGQVVQPADALYTVADLSQVWLSAEVPELQAEWVHGGDQADAEIPALPDQTVHGRIIYVSDVVNPETRTITVRMEVANPDRDLKPQMLANLLIRKTAEKVLIINDGAVVREDDRDYVFIEKTPKTFELRAVQLAEAEGHNRPVVSGLKPGERIVVDGAFHLNNERLRKELE